MNNIIKLNSIERVKKSLPISDELQSKIIWHKKEISDILLWKSDKKLLIIWPCSMDYKYPILDYANRLKTISDKISDKIKVVMRTYTWKPRTTVWRKGMLYNWEHWSNWNINDGIMLSRELMIAINKIWLPVADELLYPNLIWYTDDLVSYLAVWARSVENQSHREVASWLDIPIWLKNPTSWDMLVLVNSLISVRTEQDLIINGRHVCSQWNENSHIVLRWSCLNWDVKSNISVEDIDNIKSIMRKVPILSKIIVDLNHDNSWKNWYNQQNNLLKVLELSDPDIVWLMIESYIYDWNQNANSLSHNEIIRWKSITDHCLWIDKTSELIDKWMENLID